MPGNEESYLRRAAINASLDLLRTRHTRPTLELKEELLTSVRPAAGELPDLELKNALRRAFSNLSPRSAEIFVLHHFEDFSNRQIAEALNISPVLVAVNLHRARRQLQKEIRSYMGGAN